MSSDVQYMCDGKVIATDPQGLKAWIMANSKEDFELWADGQFDSVSFYTMSVQPSDILRMLPPEEYYREMEYWVEHYLKYKGEFDDDPLDIIGISVVEVLPPSYRIEPAIDPWEVGVPEVYGYYEDADSMQVGDVYTNSAYKVIRTNNRTPSGRRWRA